MIFFVLCADAEAKQLDRNMREDVRKTGKRPRDAFTETMASIPKKFRTADQQSSIVARLPAYREVKRGVFPLHQIAHVGRQPEQRP